MTLRMKTAIPLLLVLFLFLAFQILTDKEPMEGTVPIAFPRVDTIQMPSNVKADDPLVVQGPVVLGIAGSKDNVTYLESNKNQLSFNASGYDRALDAALFTDENGMTIQAGKTNLVGDVNSGIVTSTQANLTSLQVNRTDSDPKWGTGIHTTDVYANGTVGAGTNGQVAAYLNVNGDMGCTNAYLNDVRGETLFIQNDNILASIDNLRNTIRQAHEEANERNRQYENARLKKLADEAAAAFRNMGNSIRGAFGF